VAATEAGETIGLVRVWDWKTEAVAAEHELQPVVIVTALSFSKDGRTVLIGSGDRDLRIWDWDTMTDPSSMRAHTAGITAVTFSPDGRFIATGGEDRAVKIWQWESETLVAEMLGYNSGISSVAFSPDGRYIVAGAKDGTVKIWEWQQEQQGITLLTSTDEIARVEFSSGDPMLLISDAGGVAGVYPCYRCAPTETLVALAKSRVTRELTDDERERFLHNVD
jgi:WD40 repeat protein